MDMFIRRAVVCVLALFTLYAAPAMGQVTREVTYQGQLHDSGSPASGLYDLTFELFDAETNGTSIGIVTNVATVVSNSLFTVMVDFGMAAFDGPHPPMGE